MLTKLRKRIEAKIARRVIEMLNADIETYRDLQAHNPHLFKTIQDKIVSLDQFKDKIKIEFLTSKN